MCQTSTGGLCKFVQQKINQITGLNLFSWRRSIEFDLVPRRRVRACAQFVEWFANFAVKVESASFVSHWSVLRPEQQAGVHMPVQGAGAAAHAARPRLLAGPGELPGGAASLGWHGRRRQRAALPVRRHRALRETARARRTQTRWAGLQLSGAEETGSALSRSKCSSFLSPFSLTGVPRENQCEGGLLPSSHPEPCWGFQRKRSDSLLSFGLVRNEGKGLPRVELSSDLG